jgi:hypothetical protein
LENVEVCVGTAFGCEEDGGCGDGRDSRLSCPPALREALDRPHEEVALLYPGETARPLRQREDLWQNVPTAEGKPTHGGRSSNLTLLVLDGTWAQTQTMYQQSPALQRLPRYMFADEADSLFDPIRQEPAGHCTSTLEAVARALRILGGGSGKGACNDDGDDDGGTDDGAEAGIAAADALENSLRAMVEGQMRYAGDASRSRPRTKNGGDDDRVSGAKGRKVRRRRRAQLSLPRPLSEEEREAGRIRFIYVAHLG